MDEKKALYAKNFLKIILKASNISPSDTELAYKRLKPIELQIAIFLLNARMTSDKDFSKRLLFNTQEHLAQWFSDYSEKDTIPVDSTISKALTKLENLGLITKERDFRKKDVNSARIWLAITFIYSEDVHCC